MYKDIEAIAEHIKKQHKITSGISVEKHEDHEVHTINGIKLKITRDDTSIDILKKYRYAYSQVKIKVSAKPFSDSLTQFAERMREVVAKPMQEYQKRIHTKTK